MKENKGLTTEQTKPLDTMEASLRRPYWDGRRRVAFGMVAPAFIILVILMLGPMLFMFINAFRAWNLVVPVPPRFVGFKNFADIFANSRFYNAFLNTILLMVIGIALQSVVGLAIALLLKKPFRFRSAVLSLLLIPVLIAPVVIGLNWKLILSEVFGPLNYFLRAIGLNGPLWLSSNRFWGLFSILIVDAWQWTPFVAVVFLAGLENIPPQVYEAANIDGARPPRVFFRITLPMLRPIFMLVLLLRTIFIFRIFDPIYVMTQGGPGTATESLSLFTFYTAAQYFDMGHAMALAVLQVIFMIILANVFLKFFVVKKVQTRGR